MSNFKGTKGKWELDARDSRCCINQGDNKAICDVWGDGVSSINNYEMKANAQLIAHAPEMLEMLENVLEIEVMDSDTYCNIIELIKKATDI